MNTKKYANRFDTDGSFVPVYFEDNAPTFQDALIEFACGMIGLISLGSLIFIMAAL